jgi:hypothetical protein
MRRASLRTNVYPVTFQVLDHGRTAIAPRGGAIAFLAVLMLLATSLFAAHADGEVLAVDPLGAAAPVLWNGGVAWQDVEGVSAVTPGAAPRRLVSFRALGNTYAFSLDSGSGSGGAGGALAYGWEEANDMTPPMGPGDTNIPSPPLPYETSITHRGLIEADGHVAQLPSCGAEEEELGISSSYQVSLAGSTVAYLCTGIPPGGHVPALSSYLALSSLAALSSPTQTIAEVGGAFQISGDYIAYGVGGLSGSRRLVVAKRDTGAVSYEVPETVDDSSSTPALQEDGTLVLLGVGTSACPKPVGSSQSFPAEWFSPVSPTAHQLGCFYGGALRPVAGQWVALAPGPGTQASLVLLTLATGASRTLAVFPNPGVFQLQPPQTPPSQQFGGGADFDGHRLAWTQQTCAGAAIELTPDVAAMAPGPTPLSTRCPVIFHVHGALRPDARGVVRVRLSCPLGCTVTAMHIGGSRVLSATGPSFFFLPASSRPVTRSFRLSRAQRTYLRRRGHVRVVLSAVAAGLGSAPGTKSAVRVTLAR